MLQVVGGDGKSSPRDADGCGVRKVVLFGGGFKGRGGFGVAQVEASPKTTLRV